MSERDLKAIAAEIAQHVVVKAELVGRHAALMADLRSTREKLFAAETSFIFPLVPR